MSNKKEKYTILAHKGIDSSIGNVAIFCSYVQETKTFLLTIVYSAWEDRVQCFDDHESMIHEYNQVTTEYVEDFIKNKPNLTITSY